MNDVFPAMKAQLCNEIADLVAEMRRLHIDNRHEGVRHANSVKHHLHIDTLKLTDASYDDLIEFRDHLKGRCEDGRRTQGTQSAA